MLNLIKIIIEIVDSYIEYIRDVGTVIILFIICFLITFFIMK